MCFKLLALSTGFAILMTEGSLAAPECAIINDDVERLECYDELHRPASTPSYEGASDPPERIDWSIREDVSRMTDDRNVFVSVRAGEPIRCGYKDERAVLLLRCLENTTAVTLVTNCFMADIQGYGQVEYRVDDRPMARRNFQESTDNMALGLWSYGKARPFIDDLVGGERIVLRVTPFNDSPKEIEFAIGGTSQAIEPLRETCGW